MNVKVPCHFEEQLTVLSTGSSLKELLEMKKTVLPVPLAEAHHILVLPVAPMVEPVANSDIKKSGITNKKLCHCSIFRHYSIM